MNNVLKSRAFDRRLLFQRRPTTCRFEPTLRGPGVALRQTAAGTREKPSLYFTLGRRRFMSLFTTGRHRVKKPLGATGLAASLPTRRPSTSGRSVATGLCSPVVSYSGQRQAATIVDGRPQCPHIHQLFIYLARVCVCWPSGFCFDQSGSI